MNYLQENIIFSVHLFLFQYFCLYLPARYDYELKKQLNENKKIKKGQ